jgi:uncharacterized protein (TIGR00369 family)
MAVDFILANQSRVGMHTRLHSIEGFMIGCGGDSVTNHEERVRQSFSRQAFMSTLGAELTAVVQGGVEIRLPFSPILTQQNGYLHAGAITAVLDSACGYAALTMAADDKDVLSVEFKVNLLAPAAGEVFAVRAQVKRAGRTLTVCTADAFAITDGKEKVVATMLATIMAVPLGKPTEPPR